MTSSQSRAHFLRQAKGRSQARQVLLGKSPFLTIFPDDAVARFGIGEDCTLGWGLATCPLGRLASVLVDRALAEHIPFPAGWLRLRLAMSGGLGLLTLLIAAAAAL